MKKLLGLLASLFLATSLQAQQGGAATPVQNLAGRMDNSDQIGYATIQTNGVAGIQRTIANFVAGANVTITPSDVAGVSTLTIASTGGGGGGIATDAIWTAAGQLVYGTGTATAVVLAPGTATQLLHGGTTPSWAAVDVSTAQITGLLPFANIASGTALTLFGRSANSTGVMAGISATAASDCAFRESGSTLGCGTLATAAYAAASVTYAKVQNVAALSLFGRSANSSGVGADVSCTAASGNVFRETGSTIGCSALPVTAPVTNTTGTIGISITTTNPGGAVVAQASTPGTKQTSTNYNVDGVGAHTADAIATTPQDSVLITNTTAATAGVTRQYSPNLTFCGHAWNTTGLADEKDCIRQYIKSNTGNPTQPTFNLGWSIAGGAFSDVVTIDQTGLISTNGGIFMSNVGADGIQTTGRGTFGNSGTDGEISTTTNGGQQGGWRGGFFKQQSDANIATAVMGPVQSELLTLSTGGTTTATVGNLARANARIRAIEIRVTTAIVTATAFTVKVTGGNVFNLIGTGAGTCGTVTLGATYVLVPAAYADQYNTGATTLTITTTGTPTAGALRIEVFDEVFTPPTS